MNEETQQETNNNSTNDGVVNVGKNEESIRDEKGRIKPGKTLNPGGRPRKKKLEDYYSEEELGDLILRIKQDALTKGDIMKLVTEQIFGKAMQSMDVTTGGKEFPQPILEIKNVCKNNSNEQNNSTE